MASIYLYTGLLYLLKFAEPRRNFDFETLDLSRDFERDRILKIEPPELLLTSLKPFVCLKMFRFIDFMFSLE